MVQFFGHRFLFACYGTMLLYAAQYTGLAQGQVVIEDIVYHRATNTGTEGGQVDTGGALFVFLRNTGATPQSFVQSNITVDGQNVGNYSSFDWSRVWPLEIGPNEVATLTIKGRANPFNPGNTINFSLTSDSGAVIAGSKQLTTPQLRVGNVIPSQDMRSSFVYLRNLDPHSSYTIDRLFLNDEVTANSTFVGNSQTIGPNSVQIIKVDHGDPLPLLKPMAVRVEATRTADTSPVSVGAPIRITEPFLPTGTYSSNVNREEHIMEDVRLSYGHSVSWMPGAFPQTLARYHKYGIRGMNDSRLDFVESGGNWDLNTVRDPATNQTAPLFSLPPAVAALANNEGIYAWYLKDEPDLQLGSSHRNPQAMWRLNETFWRNSNKPTYINLVADNHVQRYGLITDHVSIDHYMQFAPLNHGSTFANTYHIDEALRYADSMKNNVEPLRMWWIPQGVSHGTWGNQPTDWGIAVQFWSSIMGGAKGIIGFKYDAGNTMRNSYPTQFQRQTDLMHELQMVRNLILYGETIDNVTVSAPAADMAARSIISENAVVVPVVNLTGRYNTGIFGSGANVQFDMLNNVSVTIPVPDWINVAQVKEVTPNGFMPVSYNQVGQQVTISMAQLRDSRIFVLSEFDEYSPERITTLRLTERDPNDPFYQAPPPGHSFLSWMEPFDNFGIKGYQVFENGQLIGDVRTPAFSNFIYDPTREYTVRAYDAAGNLGPISNIVGNAPVPVGGPLENRVLFSPAASNNFAVYDRTGALSWGTNSTRSGTFGNPGDKPYIADIDGDGIDDLIMVSAPSSAAHPWTFAVSYSYSGHAGVLLPGSAGVVQYGSAFNGNYSQVLFGDLDGDGIADPIGIRRTPAGIAWSAVLSDGQTGFADAASGSTVVEGSFFGLSDVDQVLLGDMNGNGIVDRVIFRPWTNGQGSNGLQVFVDYSEAGSFGDGFVDDSTILLNFANDTLSITDINGDGYDDLVVVRNLQTRFQTLGFLSTSDGLRPTALPPTSFDLAGLGNPSAGDMILFGSFEIGTHAGDFNGDGVVDAADYIVWRKMFGNSVPQGTFADANGDGIVDTDDLAIWQRNFGKGSFVGSGGSGQTSESGAVPEPTSASAVLVLSLLLGLYGQRWVKR